MDRAGAVMRTRFQDRGDAGRQLAVRLASYAHRSDVVVLALPNGGVPVGYEVARRLHAPLDVFLVHQLGLPGQEELAMGAITSGGATVLNEDIVEPLGISKTVIDAVAERERAELVHSEHIFRNGRPPLALRDRVVILIDDSLAASSTMCAAINAVRRQEPARVVVGVPVGARMAIIEVERLADEVVCILVPGVFHAAGFWYRDDAAVGNAEVCALVERAVRSTPICMTSGRLARLLAPT